jgi:hypothetical protein
MLPKVVIADSDVVKGSLQVSDVHVTLLKAR